MCCTTFFFLLNVGLRLTLEYQTISPSSKSPSSILVHSPSSGSTFSNTSTLLTTVVYTLKLDMLVYLHQKDFRYRNQIILVWASHCPNHRLWYHLLEISRGETLGRSNKNETRVKPTQGMVPPSTQNLKTLSLWVFFLICYSTFSFLLNVRLRVILKYLIKLESYKIHIKLIIITRKKLFKHNTLIIINVNNIIIIIKIKYYY